MAWSTMIENSHHVNVNDNYYQIWVLKNVHSTGLVNILAWLALQLRSGYILPLTERSRSQIFKPNLSPPNSFYRFHVRLFLIICLLRYEVNRVQTRQHQVIAI